MLVEKLRQKKDPKMESFIQSREIEMLWLRFFALHHDFPFVVELSFVPVGAVEHVRLACGGACAHVGCCQGVVGATLPRARFALPSFGMCHNALVVESFQCCPARVDVICVISVIRRGVLPFGHVQIAIVFVVVDGSVGFGQMNQLEDGVCQVQLVFIRSKDPQLVVVGSLIAEADGHPVASSEGNADVVQTTVARGRHGRCQGHAKGHRGVEFVQLNNNLSMNLVHV